MDILEDLDYLRHYDYLLDYLLQDVGHFNESLFMCNDLHWLMDSAVYYLQNFFDVTDLTDYFLESVVCNCLLHQSIYLSDLYVVCTHLNRLLNFQRNLFDRLHDDGNLHNLLHN